MYLCFYQFANILTTNISLNFFWNYDEKQYSNIQLIQVSFCREIKKGGLMVLGSVIVGDIESMAGKNLQVKIRKGWNKYITDRSIKGTCQIMCTNYVQLCTIKYKIKYKQQYNISKTYLHIVVRTNFFIFFFGSYFYFFWFIFLFFGSYFYFLVHILFW